MKNRRVLYIFLALFFIVSAVLLSSVLFSIKSALLSPAGDTSLIDSANVKLELDKIINKNIFFIDEKSIINAVEKDNPYIEVINIERIFPSEVKLHYTGRKELYELKTGDSYAVIDAKGKTLKICETPQGFTKLEFDYGNLSVCDVLTDKNTKDALSVFAAFTTIAEDGRVYDSALFNAYFQSVHKESAEVINLKTRAGAEFYITDFKNQTAQKVFQALYIFENELDEGERAAKKVYI